MLRVLNFYIVLLFFIFIDILSVHAQDVGLEEPELLSWTSEICHPSLSYTGKLNNVAVEYEVGVYINGAGDNRFVPPNSFVYESVSSPTDTIVVIYSIGEDSVQSQFIFNVYEGVVIDTFVSICSSELPYSWRGNDYNYAGIFSNFLGTGTGYCDDEERLHLEVLPVENDTIVMNICSVELPVIWNGITINEVGGAVAVYETSNIYGCDSVVVLNLFGHENKFTVVNDTVCFNDLPMEWNGFTLSSGGASIATYNTFSHMGCDSVVTLNLHIAHNVTVNQYDTICASELPYIWNGIPVFTEMGGVTYHTASVAGCDSFVNLYLTVRPTLYTDIVDTVCSGDWPYSWMGNSYYESGDYIDSVILTSSTFGCDSILRLSLVSGISYNNTQTLTICSSELPYNWNDNLLYFGGDSVAIYNYSSALGCDSLVYLNLIVNPSILDTITLEKCSGEFPFLWNGILVELPGEGVANFSSFTVNGCDSILVLNVLELPIAQVYDTVNLCSIQFPFSWQDLSISSSGSYSYIVEAECDTIKNLLVIEIENPFSEEIMEICEGTLPIIWNGITVNEMGERVAYIGFSTDEFCDSVRYLNLLPIDLPMVPIIAAAGEQLGVVNLEVGVAYQWQKYNSSSESWINIDGANESEFIPLESGLYRVGANFPPCETVYSSEFEIEVLPSNLPNYENNNFNIEPFPNPAHETISVKLPKVNTRLNIQVYDSQGNRMFLSDDFINELFVIDIKDWPNGNYVIVVNDIDNGSCWKSKFIVLK